jgi:hypothetical protein
MGLKRLVMVGACIASTVALGGCNLDDLTFGLLGEPKLSTVSYERFEETYQNIVDHLAKDDPNKQKQFELAFRKATAYTAFRVDQVQLSQDHLEVVNIASILPDNAMSIRKNAYAGIGKSLDNATADTVINLAKDKEEETIHAYQGKVDRVKAEIEKQISDTKAKEEKTRRYILSSVLFNNPTVVAESMVGSNMTMPMLTLPIINGTTDTIVTMTLLVTLNDRDGKPLISKPVTLKFNDEVLSPSGNRTLKVALGDQEWFGLPVGNYYPVNIEVQSYITDSRVEVSNADSLREIAALEKRRADLEAFKQDIAKQIRESFDKPPTRKGLLPDQQTGQQGIAPQVGGPAPVGKGPVGGGPIPQVQPAKQ